MTGAFMGLRLPMPVTPASVWTSSQDRTAELHGLDLDDLHRSAPRFHWEQTTPGLRDATGLKLAFLPQSPVPGTTRSPLGAAQAIRVPCRSTKPCSNSMPRPGSSVSVS